ncbi:MAG: energy-coupling factor transporter ATPase, partial [Gemmatimonadetes bacterium]|nr:energy-coupling factor transporter ATPase [Gemmatimonadota bacterium]
ADGQTIVLATHSMDDAAQLADRIIVLHDGRVIMEGRAREVFGRAEDLERIGLGIPQAARLIQAIRARGLAVADALTIDQARTAIIAALRGARHGAH